MCIVVVPEIKRLFVYVFTSVLGDKWKVLRTKNERCPNVGGAGSVRLCPEGARVGRRGGGTSGSTDLLFLSTVKRCRTLCGPFHDDSSGEIPIIYGYFVPNPEKYCPVKGMCLLYAWVGPICFEIRSLIYLEFNWAQTKHSTCIEWVPNKNYNLRKIFNATE